MERWQRRRRCVQMRAHSPDWRTGGSANLAGVQVAKHCDAVERINATTWVKHGDPLFTTCVIGAFLHSSR